MLHVHLVPTRRFWARRRDGSSGICCRSDVVVIDECNGRGNGLSVRCKRQPWSSGSAGSPLLLRQLAHSTSLCPPLLQKQNQHTVTTSKQQHCTSLSDV